MRSTLAGGCLPAGEGLDHRVHALLAPGLQGRLDLGVAAAAAAEDRRVGGLVFLDEVEEAVEAGGELLGGGEVGVGRGQLRQLLLAALEGGDEEVLLGREVVVEQALGDAGGAGDLLDRDLVVGALGEQAGAGGEQLLAPGVGAEPAFRRSAPLAAGYSLLTDQFNSCYKSRHY